MSLPGMDSDGSEPVKRRSDYDVVARDILGPPKSPKGGRKARDALLWQLVFGYVGAGYFYLGEARRGVLSAVCFIVGALAVVFLEMQVFPSQAEVVYSLMWVHYVAVAVFVLLFVGYAYAAYDCYMIGRRRQKSGGGGRGLLEARELSREEKLERVFSEHDSRGSSDAP